MWSKKDEKIMELNLSLADYQVQKDVGKYIEYLMLHQILNEPPLSVVLNLQRKILKKISILKSSKTDQNETLIAYNDMSCIISNLIVEIKKNDDNFEITKGCIND